MAESTANRTARQEDRPRGPLGRRVAGGARAGAVSLATLVALGASGCLLPVRTAPGVEGRVVDQASGEPITDALVVVRYDGHYGGPLPDREHLGHLETTTDADGRFELPRYTRGGLSIWPGFRTEARVAAVLRDGYRCATPQHVEEGRAVRIPLTPALDIEDQRQSCRPIASRRGETDAYRSAWHQLFPPAETPADREQQRQIARLLRARASMGFGENCEGPISNLTLAPDGGRVAFVAPRGAGAQVQIVELAKGGPGAPRVTSELGADRDRRLAWNGAGDLVLWREASAGQRTISASVFAPGRSEVVWTASPPVPISIDEHAPLTQRRDDPRRPLEPADLSDEAETLWLGRSFALESGVDPDSGLAADRLIVTREDASRYAIDLPGESCGGSRYGRPQYRIGAEGRLAFDLRFIEGGCHAVAIDLERGEWQRLDRSAEKASCRAQRGIPPAQFRTALRGWSRELGAALAAAGADEGASYAIRIEKDGSARVQARDFAGASISVEAPPFPLSTPLRRIDVTHVAPHSGGSRAFPQAPPADLEPL